jgi:RNA polymerase sigma factor (sigma-70 family)
MSYSSAAENPLLSNAPQAWDGLIEAVGPASLLVAIQSRMSAGLHKHTTPEDILQESLMHAWRDRQRCQWNGLRSFRSWLLTIIDNRIREAADALSAQKRGGGREPIAFSALQSGSSDGAFGPIGSTTPSRIAIYQEQAAAMRTALERLSDDVREVVRLRLFDQLEIADIAQRLSIGESAVRHRFRKGAEAYHRLLKEAIASRATTTGITSPISTADSSPVR